MLAGQALKTFFLLLEWKILRDAYKQNRFLTVKLLTLAADIFCKKTVFKSCERN